MQEAVIREALEPMDRIAGNITAQLRELRSYEEEIDLDFTQIDESLALGIFNVDLLGRAQIWADVRSQVKAEVKAQPKPKPQPSPLAAALGELGFEVLPFEEAIKFFRDKVNLPASEFYELADQARTKAFSIRVGATEQVRDHIKDILTRAQSDGIALDEFRKQAQPVIDAAGIGVRNVDGEPMDPDWYWRTVYKTNMDTAYQAGRWQQMTDPEVLRERPYIRYVSALLPTSRASHREKHGVVLPAEDEFWSKWMPPNGFNCYCTTMSVSESLLTRRGWTVSDKNFVYPEPDEGFASNPGKG